MTVWDESCVGEYCTGCEFRAGEEVLASTGCIGRCSRYELAGHVDCEDVSIPMGG